MTCGFGPSFLKSGGSKNQLPGLGVLIPVNFKYLLTLNPRYGLN
jgi:hypothetical protein